MPMNGKTREEIIARREELTILLKERFGNNVTVIDSIIEDTSKGPVWCLGQSVSMMQGADLVVFDKGWRDARGCKVEYDVCSYYGFKFMEI